jgi:hypothetical protein
MVEALTTLACASPANCFFQVSKPAALLPHCAALPLPDIPATIAGQSKPWAIQKVAAAPSFRDFPGF